MKRVGIGALILVLAAGLMAFWAPTSPWNDVPAGAEPDKDESRNGTLRVSSFYDVDPSTLPPAAPGTFMKSERIRPLPGISQDGYELYRFMYHSTTINGEDIPVSGLLGIPTGDPPPTGWPSITYAHGTMGSAPKCGLSIAPQSRKTVSGFQFDSKVKPLLERGYAVIATDYQGMGPPVTPMYLLGDAEGRNLLDSIRAVQQWRDDINPSTVLWGHSQGGQAVLFASQIQSDYAPELDIQGTVSIAPAIIPPVPFALEIVGSSPDPSGQTYLISGAVGTWIQNYSDLDAEDVFTEKGIDALSALKELCGSDLNEFYQQAPMSEYIKIQEAANNPRVLKAVQKNLAGGEPLNSPLLLVQGMADEVVINPETPSYFALLCQQRESGELKVPTQLELYPDDNHLTIIPNAAEQVDQWIQDRMAGEEAPSNCPNQDRS